MIDKIVNNEYEIIIGIETHVELKTNSKIFCSCSTEYVRRPNSNVCEICMGMPGTLPVFNKKVLDFAILVSHVLNCNITRKTRFDRKHYFSIDLPKAYQITQFHNPIGKGGYLEIDIDGHLKSIGIQDIHMEEDACKVVNNEDSQLIDYNRAGIPLLEIVSKPDISSSKEARLYLEKLRGILIYLGVSDCKMEEGSFRADINISVRPIGHDTLGERTEIKNLNSFKIIEKAIEYESNRQIEILNSGGIINKETRKWDKENHITTEMRDKENQSDYRYIPEPDIPQIVLKVDEIERLTKNLPELRDEKVTRYQEEFSLTEEESLIITSNKMLADFFEETVRLCTKPKEVANWLIMDCMRMLRETNKKLEEAKLKPENLAYLINLIEEKKINQTLAKEVFNNMFIKDISPQDYIKEKRIEIIDDEEVLTKIIKKVIKLNKQSVMDYNSGKEKALTYLIGQTMKESKGMAEPNKLRSLILEILSKNIFDTEVGEDRL